jgi:NDP-sugar pyrophosphorylase family protein
MTKTDDTKTELPHTIYAKNLTALISQGTEDVELSVQELKDIVSEALEDKVKRVTFASGYYILDGEVCLETDYDEKTKTRKPGTLPPEWARKKNA